MKPVIDIKDLFYSYDNNPVLEDINLKVDNGDFVAFIGPNGGGKTTLIKLILGFLKPTKGNIRIMGKMPEHAGSEIGYVPQFAEFDKHFPIRVLDVVLGGLIHSSSFFPGYSREDKMKARKALDAVGISRLEKNVLGTLSGGQKQRVLIARALVSKPKLLVLDEPTASVDSNVERDIYDLFQRLNKEMTIVLVTHDLGFVSPYINRVACINRQISVHLTSEVDDKVILDTYLSPMKIISHKCGL